MHRLVTQTDVGNRKLIQFLYKADHRSPLEHASMSLHLRGVSRAFMAQITRHRLASYTCSSQHYQDYRDYPMIDGPYTKGMILSAEEAVRAYSRALDDGVPKDHARMVLPEGMTVNMVMTANAREWAEIAHQRLCKRNTSETLYIAEIIKEKLDAWFPELFEVVGPECFEGGCKQGPMSCGEPV